MHTIYVIGVMFVMPAFFVILEYCKRKKNLLFLFCKWFVFWSVGIRGLTGGLMQILNPSYTAELLQVVTNDPIVIQELGFCNLSFGILGILSLFRPSYRKPAALAYALFLAGAALLHLLRINIVDIGEFMSMTGDIFVVALAVIVFIEDGKVSKQEIPRQ